MTVSLVAMPKPALHPHLIFFILCAVFLCGFGPPTLRDKDGPGAQRITAGQLRQMENAGSPPAGISARSVLVYDVDADRLLVQQNPEVARPPASLSKLMTALLILEKGGLEQRVAVEMDDLVGGSTMNLRTGEVLTAQNLLWGLVVASGNDAAMSLARHHSGQVHIFVQRMNLRAQELGLTQTKFANPHGLDANDQFSSAQDLLVLTELLWEFPLFREMAGTAAIEVAGHDLVSTNQLLGVYPRVNGVKTGTTNAAGENLIVGVDRDGHQLFIVILGSQDRYFDARSLIAAADQSFGWASLGTGLRPTAVDRVYDADGKRWYLRAEGEKPSIFLPAWERQKIRIYRRLQLPPPGLWSPGASAGVLEWRLGEAIVATQRLVLYLP